MAGRPCHQAPSLSVIRLLLQLRQRLDDARVESDRSVFALPAEIVPFPLRSGRSSPAGGRPDWYRQ
jgi:hypothetical protein